MALIAQNEDKIKQTKVDGHVGYDSKYIYIRHSGEPIENHSDIEVNSYYISKDIDDDKSTCYGNSVYDIFDNDQNKITLHSKVWFKTNKANWKCMVIRIPHRDLECDANYLRIKWIENKAEDTVLIKYLKKRFSIGTQSISVGLIWKNQLRT